MRQVLTKRFLPALAALGFLLAPSAAPFSFGIGPANAQAPPPVAALPDAERRTSYSISGTTCACAVNFQLYATGTDVDAWLEVWLGGVRYLSTDPTFGWSLSSITGSLATIPRPITNAVLTFNAVQTGTVQIVGAERPRRLAQFAENRGVAARDLNLAITDIVATQRDAWDKINDVTGRAIVGLPGETIAPLPSATARAGGFLCWDATGLIPLACGAGSGSGNVIGPNSAVDGHIAVFNGATGKIIKDGGALGSGTVTGPVSSTNLGFVRWNGTTGLVIQDGPATIGAATGGTGATTLTAHGVVVGEGTSAVAIVTDTTGGKLLLSQSGGDPVWSATPTLGINGTTTGVLALANGGGSGGTVQIQNNSATSVYNFNLPATAGTAGQILTSGGGVNNPMTWTGVTGSGSVVLATSPTLVTPTLGVATATTLNGMTFTGSLGSSVRVYGWGDTTTIHVNNGASDVVAVGQGAAQNCTTCSQGVYIGTGGTGQLITTEGGDTFVGYAVAPSQNGSGNQYNSGFGNGALALCTTCGGMAAFGRSAGRGETAGNHNAWFGHASGYFGTNNVQVAGFGDGAGGGDIVSGTAIPAGLPNTGTVVFGFNADTNIECIGETCGKATSAARKNAACIGSYCRIPGHDNVGWLGNGYQAVGSAGAVFDGTHSVTLNGNTGQTIPAATLVAGFVNRTGSAGGGISDTTATAAQIVAASIGNGAEVSVSRIIYYSNATGQVVTFTAGVGVTVSGTATISNGGVASFMMTVTNSTASSEAVVFTRLGT